MDIRPDEPTPSHRMWLRHGVLFPSAVLLSTAVAQLATAVFWFAGGIVLAAWLCKWAWTFPNPAARDQSRWPRIAGLLIIACVALFAPPGVGSGHDIDIAEAVFRNAITDNGHDQVYFLSIQGKDPPLEVFDRLADLGHRIRPVSAAQLPGHEGKFHKWNVCDRETGEDGIILCVSAIGRSWPFLLEATAEGSSYVAPLGGAGHTYIVIWIGGGWLVTNQRMNWVS